MALLCHEQLFRMLKLSTDSKSDLLTHIGIILTASLILFLLFFFVYLPWTTNLNEEVQVPDLNGLDLRETERVLDAANLKYEVADSTYVNGLQPLTVFSQYPKAADYVKKGRKIFLTIITNNVPRISLPDVIGRSVSSASSLLSGTGLIIEQTEFIPAIEKNTVLRLKFEGREISPGSSIPKGSKITLVAGDGFGNTEVIVPDLTGMSYEEADIIVAGSSLNMGSIMYDNSSGMPEGMVVRQRPEAGSTLRLGETVNIWISGNSNEIN
jgi:beta-lactam-binding protein with PASTA domain